METTKLFSQKSLKEDLTRQKRQAECLYLIIDIKNVNESINIKKKYGGNMYYTQLLKYKKMVLS